MRKPRRNYEDWREWPPFVIEIYRQAKAEVEPVIGVELAKKHGQRQAASAWAKSEGHTLRWLLVAGQWLRVWGNGGPTPEEHEKLERVVRQLSGEPSAPLVPPRRTEKKSREIETNMKGNLS